MIEIELRTLQTAVLFLLNKNIFTSFSNGYRVQYGKMRTYKFLTPSKQISVIEGSAITISVSKISEPIFIKQKTATRCASVGFRNMASG